MTGKIKRWIIAAVIMLILGLALFAGAMAVQHWDFNLLNMEW